MKKIDLCLLLLALFFTLLLASCQKEKEKEKRQISERDILVTQQLRDFQHTLQLKTTGSMSTEDADWHIEGLLNLEQAYNYHDFVNLQFTKDSIILVSSNDSISGDQIELAFEYFLNILETFANNQNNPNFGYDIIDVYPIETQLKDGSVIMYMESAFGDGLAYNYIPFNPDDDYWYWGWDMGKCDAYQGQGIGEDAADKLEFRFNHPIAVLEPGYFTFNQHEYAYPWDYDDPLNPGPYGDFMMFFYDSNIPPAVEPCLSPTELNYYLSKFDFIKADNQPAGKTFKVVEVVDDLIIGTEGRLHWYDLTYGIFTLSPQHE